MADGRHIENRLLAISPRVIVRLTRKFVWRSRITFRHRLRDQNTKFWKFKMADDRHFENSFIAISQLRIIRFPWNLVNRLKFWLQERLRGIYKKIMKFKMADSRRIENRFWLYLHELLSDWRGIWHVQVESCSDTRHVTKIAIFENSRWRTAASLQMVSSLGYISAGDHPISIKFGVPLQILVLRTVRWQSVKILQSPNGGRPPYWKSFFFGYTSRFIVRLTRNLIRRSRITFRYKSHDQNTKIWKFKMADDRHFENGFTTISQLRIIRFQWNLVCRCIIWFQKRSHIKVSKFCKFKMEDGRFVCERLCRPTDLVGAVS